MSAKIVIIDRKLSGCCPPIRRFPPVLDRKMSLGADETTPSSATPLPLGPYQKGREVGSKVTIPHAL